jgi:hypothetical protein
MRHFNFQFGTIIFAATCVVGVFALPAWTMASGHKILASEEYIEAVAKEHTYCNRYAGGADCGCFGQKSAHVLGHKTEQVYGYVHANQTQLARGQAISECR